MANQLNGEVTVTQAERTYTLVFDYEALCQAEDLLDRDFADIVGSLRLPVIVDGQMVRGPQIRRTPLRALAWAALRHHHPELALSAVGNLIQSGGTLAWSTAIMGAIAKAFPRPGDDEGEGASSEADPLTAATDAGPSPGISESGES